MELVLSLSDIDAAAFLIGVWHLQNYAVMVDNGLVRIHLPDAPADWKMQFRQNLDIQNFVAAHAWLRREAQAAVAMEAGFLAGQREHAAEDEANGAAQERAMAEMSRQRTEESR